MSSFDRLPQPGERFYGEVLDCEPNGKILLEIPGLSVDDLAMAVIPAGENPSRKKFIAKAELLVEVIELKPEGAGYHLIICRMAK
jgi:hypothetical protein